LAAELESILTQASTFLSVTNNKIYYKQLEKIVKTPTNYKQLGVIEKARIARYLVFIQYPIENMKSAIEMIEMIKTIYRISLDEALEFFYSFNLLINRLEDRNINYYDINSIHSRLNKLPITPNEFLEIFKNTKMTLISGNCDLDEYFEKITEFLNKGYSKTRIISELNK